MATNKQPTKRKGGRKALWDELDIPSRLDMIKGWAMQGSTDAEIMEMLGVKKDVFYKWKKDKPEFKEALKKGRYDSNGEILKSAFKQTQGYYVTEQQAVKLKKTIVKKVDGKTHYVDEEVVEIVDLMKYVQPSTPMTIFMLKNRLPEHYRDKPQPNDNKLTESDGFEEALNATTEEVWEGEEDGDN